MHLNDWLAHCERLHPTAIDMTLDRVKAVRDRMGLRFTAPVISVAGTNGKGSTCAMLDAIARAAGYRVGLYSKPHLVHFEERCRIQGEMVSSDSLEAHFAAVEAARGDLTLTYFEFTTLAIMSRLAAEPLDLVILEVGMGGRLDAVNAIDADLAVITSIDLDHMEYLGPDRDTIGREKAGVLRPGRKAVCSDPMPPASIAQEAGRLGVDLRLSGRDFRFDGDRQQWRWEGRSRRFAGLAYPALRGVNQLLNAAGVLAAFEALHETLPINAQAVRMGLSLVELAGRFQVLPGQPTLVLDVAHNPHAVAALAQNLDQMGFAPRTRAVFGAMADKALDEVLAIISPWIDHWAFCNLDSPRAATASDLAARWKALAPSLKTPGEVSVSQHSHPVDAVAHVRSLSDPADRILVFGSFYTVGPVLASLGRA
ncbi:bifunctional tetrahydrofolate synthase/dihydrofolate synthase [Inhella gelatinilytica]|uniref:Dihydrofolate synthase/folylpolyglutamate synthase n=1 Tax=Inhella gelatinilytica TaxID=2795030 RepID=A0A931NDH2_9BURK|nr:bifunctional tetrahydrofolate synthase/dihydrofolate synthase [Inhella gelatinilytica]MBH9553082.1 bifunctional tetrahydrofolate synthase/dihydrofolate synthase [Inhella gelatinilytica]